MLLFTPEVTAYLEMFTLTHSLQGGFGWAAWQRTSLPAAGGVEDQPAKVMEALTVIAETANALAAENRPKRKTRTKHKRDG